MLSDQSSFDVGVPPSDSELSKPLAEEGYAFMGAVFEVHRVLGGGLLEEIYQESLEIELSLRGIPFTAKRELIVHYKTFQLQKRYVPDFHVFDRIVAEIKSCRQLSIDHECQLLNYMRITRQPVGYLVNFGPLQKAEWKRFVISEFI
jgi:GxxExxY protein